VTHIRRGAALLQRLSRIGQQVGYHLLQLVGIAEQ
jgi:hypothetical protein